MAGKRNTKKQQWNEMLSLQGSAPSGLYQVVFAEYIDRTNFTCLLDGVVHNDLRK